MAGDSVAIGIEFNVSAEQAMAQNEAIAAQIEAINAKIAGSATTGVKQAADATASGTSVMKDAFAALSPQLSSIVEGFAGGLAGGGLVAAAMAAKQMIDQAAAAAKAAIIDFSQMGLEIERISAVTGMTNEQTQRMTYMAKQLGMGAGEVAQTFRFFQRALGDAQLGAGTAGKSFENLGLDIKALKDKGEEGYQIFFKTVEALHNIPDAAERASRAQDIFGRSFMAVSMLLKAGPDEIRKYYEQARVDSDEEIAKSNALRHALVNQQDAWKQLKDELIVGFVPAGGAVIGTITKITDFALLSKEAFDTYGLSIERVIEDFIKFNILKPTIGQGGGGGSSGAGGGEGAAPAAGVSPNPLMEGPDLASIDAANRAAMAKAAEDRQKQADQLYKALLEKQAAFNAATLTLERSAADAYITSDMDAFDKREYIAEMKAQRDAQAAQAEATDATDLARRFIAIEFERQNTITQIHQDGAEARIKIAENEANKTKAAEDRAHEKSLRDHEKKEREAEAYGRQEYQHARETADMVLQTTVQYWQARREADAQGQAMAYSASEAAGLIILKLALKEIGQVFEAKAVASFVAYAASGFTLFPELLAGIGYTAGAAACGLAGGAINPAAVATTPTAVGPGDVIRETPSRGGSGSGSGGGGVPSISNSTVNIYFQPSVTFNGVMDTDEAEAAARRAISDMAYVAGVGLGGNPLGGR
jgi:hypothetical protein